jgi:hypothetical protein
MQQVSRARFCDQWDDLGEITQVGSMPRYAEEGLAIAAPVHGMDFEILARQLT